MWTTRRRFKHTPSIVVLAVAGAVIGILLLGNLDNYADSSEELGSQNGISTGVETTTTATGIGEVTPSRPPTTTGSPREATAASSVRFTSSDRVFLRGLQLAGVDEYRQVELGEFEVLDLLFVDIIDSVKGIVRLLDEVAVDSDGSCESLDLILQAGLDGLNHPKGIDIVVSALAAYSPSGPFIRAAELC